MSTQGNESSTISKSIKLAVMLDTSGGIGGVGVQGGGGAGTSNAGSLLYMTVDTSLNVQQFKLKLFVEPHFAQVLDGVQAHRVLLYHRSGTAETRLDPRKEIGSQNFAPDDLVIIRLVNDHNLSSQNLLPETSISVPDVASPSPGLGGLGGLGDAHGLGALLPHESRKLMSMTSPPHHSNSHHYHSPAPTSPRQPTKTPSVAHLGGSHNALADKTVSSRKLHPIKFSSEYLAKDMEKVKKYLPADQAVKESYECKSQIGLRSASGKVYLTHSCILFVSKKSFDRVVKLWQGPDVLDIAVTEKGIRLIEYPNLKHITFTNFADGDAREQLCRNVRRLLYGHNGNGALHHAVVLGDVDRVRALLDHDISLLNEYNSAEETPLILAVQNGPGLPKKSVHEIVELLLDYYRSNKDKVDINQTTPRGGHHILHSICRLRDVEDSILERLLKFPDMNLTVTAVHDKTTPLHYFVRYNESTNCAALGELFFEAGADVDALTAQNETPLHGAMMNKKVRGMMVQLLLQHRANVNVRAGQQADTPLYYAIKLGRPDLVDALLAAGSDITLQNAEHKDALQVATEEYENNQRTICAKDYQKNLILLNDVKRLRDMLSIAKVEDLLKVFIQKGLHDPVALVNLDEPQFEELGLVLGPKLILKKEIAALKEELDQEKKRKEVEEALKKHSTAGLAADEVRTELGVADGKWEIPHSNLEFTAKLGAGAFGTVFKGIMKPNTTVALKVLFGGSDTLTEFKKEFQILTSVSGTNIVKFYGFSLDRQLSMVMEFCEKGSLYDVIRKNPEMLDWEQALAYGKGMADGMAVLHGHTPPIFHRDMKSLNLLVNKDNVVKVCDFGLSRIVEQPAMVTLKNLRGTLAYCAPEIMAGVQFSAKSDVYSMGIVIWELIFVVVTHKYEQPFAEFGLAVEHAILVLASSGKRPTIPAGTPQIMADLYLQCVDPDPEKRPTAQQLARSFQTLQQQYMQSRDSWLKNVVTATAATPAPPVATATPITGGKAAGFGGWGKKKE